MPDLIRDSAFRGRPRTHRRRRPAGDDRGAIAALVAVLFAGGALLGMLALVVDVGYAYVERENLQTGVDAAALAVAEACVQTPVTCADTAAATVAAYASANAEKSETPTVCGVGAEFLPQASWAPAPPLPACPEPAAEDAERLTSCVESAPGSATYYTEVRTHTELPWLFGSALPGVGDSQATNVGACSRVNWAIPSAGTGVGLAMASCDFRGNTEIDFGTGSVYYPDTHDLGYKRRIATINLHQDGVLGSNGCAGGFGWWEGDDCTATVAYDDGLAVVRDVGSNVVAAIPDSCRNRLTQAFESQKEIIIPLYSLSPLAVEGLGAFVVTGFYLHDDDGALFARGLTGCPESKPHCIQGYFKRVVMPVTAATAYFPESTAPEDLAGLDFGVYTVSVTG